MESSSTQTKKSPVKGKVAKEILNVIRTTSRNNIDLTQLADNKANVLLSLSSITLTFLIPSVFAYINVIRQYHLGIPLVILVITCFVTIYICAIVLKPGKFDTYIDETQLKQRSPFSFASFYRMDIEQM